MQKIPIELLRTLIDDAFAPDDTPTPPPLPSPESVWDSLSKPQEPSNSAALKEVPPAFDTRAAMPGVEVGADLDTAKLTIEQLRNPELIPPDIARAIIKDAFAPDDDPPPPPLPSPGSLQNAPPKRTGGPSNIRGPGKSSPRD